MQLALHLAVASEFEVQAKVAVFPELAFQVVRPLFPGCWSTLVSA